MCWPEGRQCISLHGPFPDHLSCQLGSHKLTRFVPAVNLMTLPSLINTFLSCFEPHFLHTAQILWTLLDLLSYLASRLVYT